MNDFIERTARSLCKNLIRPLDPDKLVGYGPAEGPLTQCPTWRVMADGVSDAIKNMPPPSDPMISAGVCALNEFLPITSKHTFLENYELVTKIFNAMMTEALR